MRCLLLSLALASASALLLGCPAAPRLPARAAVARMELDYKDPIVAKEYASLQGVDSDDVVDELAASGIVCPPTMNDMEMRMMLVEVRMRKAGTIGGVTAKKAQKKPASYGSKFEEAMWEKPAFKELYEGWQTSKTINAMNLAAEYINNPKRAKERYAGTPNYEETVAAIAEALTAKVVREVSSPLLIFSGFPSNMGEGGVKMTLESFGPMSDFSIEESDDGMTLSGRVEYEEVSAAKQAVDKWDGMDMGLGTTLSLESI